MKRKIYTPEFKEQACGLVSQQGYSVARAASELGLPGSTLEYWLKRRGYRGAIARHEPPDSDDPQVLKARVRELEQRLRRAEMEKDILKKATAFFAQEQS